MVAIPDRKSLLAAVAALAIVALLGAAGWLVLRQFAAPSLASSAAWAPALTSLPGLPGEAPVIAEPVLAPEDARAQNAAVPIAAGAIEPAAPFRFSGTSQDQSRATECLALAALAEAGGSDQGQRAVIQVVLNRTRHPAFAKTVCGVVFQGSERRTGCQFSFTCDGSLARRYSDQAWSAARRRAAEMLGGAVYAPVGLATHYHTDWVHPYWSPKLVKLAQVETHLFFRWPGYWGTMQAMRTAYRGGEPDFRAEAPPEDLASVAAPSAIPVLPADTPKISGGKVQMRDASGRANFVVIGAGTSAAAATEIARALCKPNATCRVLGWSDAAEIPATFPVPPAARATQQFSFTRDPAGAEIVLFDCRWFTDQPREKCIPRAR
jgi:spore germination cell wall hydrolase CwlJ-like protein